MSETILTPEDIEELSLVPKRGLGLSTIKWQAVILLEAIVAKK